MEITMSRAIVNVATGHYVAGQRRLYGDLVALGKDPLMAWTDSYPTYSPTHEEIPYAFKAWALKAAHCTHGHNVLLWCDSSIVAGPRLLDDLWAKIEKDGYWIAKNPGNYSNYEWTASSAYPDLFPKWQNSLTDDVFAVAHAANRRIPHASATAFGVDLRKSIGRAILDEYLRLAQTKAFCGPWINEDIGIPSSVPKSSRVGPCGPSAVRGHRHDQTALSVIAWRLGCELTTCPDYFAYYGDETEATCLVAKGI
jgi:hypothetical protein